MKKVTKLNIALPSSFFTNGSELEKDFYKGFTDNDSQELKLVLALVSLAYKNLQKDFKKKNILEMSEISSKNSVFHDMKISKAQFINIFSNIKHSWFKYIRVVFNQENLNDVKVYFELNDDIKMLLLKEVTKYTSFRHILSYRKVRHIKAHLKLEFFAYENKPYNLYLNYACDFFDINKNGTYSNKIIQIKRIFKACKNCSDIEFLGKKNTSFNVFKEELENLEKDNISEFKKYN